MSTPAEPDGSPIEDYLDELFVRLPRHRGEFRSVLAEVEDHLRESSAAGVEAGLDPLEAEQAAVRRFGSPELVAAGFRWHRPWRLGADLLRTAWSLGAVGLVAVGISGVVAAVLRAAAGPTFLGGAATPLRGSGVDCAHLLSVQPGAGSCARAAVLETADDAVVLRLLAGAVGLLLLVALRLGRRWFPPAVLPPSFAPTVAACAFGGAAALLLAAATHLIPVGKEPVGAGFFLSGAVVAAVLAIGYASMLLRRLAAH